MEHYNNKWKMREALFFILLISIQYLHTNGNIPKPQQYFQLDSQKFLCTTESAVCQITQDTTSLANPTSFDYRTSFDHLTSLENMTSISSYKHTREKRAILTTLFVISVFASVANLGFDIYLEIKGCEGIYPSIRGYNKEIIEIRDKIKDLSKKSNDEFTRSQNTLEYLKITNKQNQDIWFHVYRIMELTKLVFEELDPTLLQSFMKRSNKLRKELVKRNQTISGMNFDSLTAEYQGIFASTESLLMGIAPVVSEIGIYAMSKGYKWYKAQKVAQAASRVGVIATPSTATQGLARTSSTAGKAIQTTSKMGMFMNAAGGLMSVVAIGFEIWSVVMKVQGCKDKRNQLKSARDKLKPEVPKFEKTYNDVKKHLSEMETEYRKVKNQIMTKLFFEYLSNITLIANSGHSIYQKANKDVIEFESKIKKANRQQTVELQAKLITALQRYTFTWSCLETQIRMVTYTRDSCAKGYGDMRTLYDQAVRNFKRVSDCTLATGENYTTFVKTEKYVRQQMKAKKLNEDCLLNNEILVNLTCKLNAKGFDTAYIVGKTGLTSKQVATIKPTCPPEDLPPSIKRFICSLKQLGQSLAFLQDFYKEYDQKQIQATFNSCPSSGRRKDVSMTSYEARFI